MVIVNDVREAVIAALNQHFPDIEIYGEEIKQGFEEPCFFVKLFPVAQDREFGRRYKRYHSFDIHYFAATNEDMHVMAERLYEHMEYIKVSGGTARGKKLRHEIVDGVLHFFVDYDFHIIREKQPYPKMQELEQEGYIKHG
ncbi:phage tail terminator family protein [Desulfotomaculum sp. 1211_IL3151]|uniref:phage tail terminator family protein n=1 Tax=Desulfotomaculum sp. 1211_IL3151 TaxID=3084055 RepID=UPI002FD9F01A